MSSHVVPRLTHKNIVACMNIVFWGRDRVACRRSGREGKEAVSGSGVCLGKPAVIYDYMDACVGSSSTAAHTCSAAYNSIASTKLTRWACKNSGATRSSADNEHKHDELN